MPAWMANFGWVFPVGAWTLYAFSVAAILWALFGDRARGRRRCPKCWYDMAGVPGLKCPECGRSAKSERRLARTKRKWRLAAVGAAVLIAGYFLAATPRIAKRGWPGAVPTAFIVAVLPWIPEGPIAGSYFFLLKPGGGRTFATNPQIFTSFVIDQSSLTEKLAQELNKRITGKELDAAERACLWRWLALIARPAETVLVGPGMRAYHWLVYSYYVGIVPPVGESVIRKLWLGSIGPIYPTYYEDMPLCVYIPEYPLNDASFVYVHDEATGMQISSYNQNASIWFGEKPLNSGDVRLRVRVQDYHHHGLETNKHRVVDTVLPLRMQRVKSMDKILPPLQPKLAEILLHTVSVDIATKPLMVEVRTTDPRLADTAIGLRVELLRDGLVVAGATAPTRSYYHYRSSLNQWYRALYKSTDGSVDPAWLRSPGNWQLRITPDPKSILECGRRSTYWRGTMIFDLDSEGTITNRHMEDWDEFAPLQPEVPFEPE